MDRDRKRDAAAQKGMMAAIRARTAEDHAATDAMLASEALARCRQDTRRTIEKRTSKNVANEVFGPPKRSADSVISANKSNVVGYMRVSRARVDIVGLPPDEVFSDSDEEYHGSTSEDDADDDEELASMSTRGGPIVVRGQWIVPRVERDVESACCIDLFCSFGGFSMLDENVIIGIDANARRVRTFATLHPEANCLCCELGGDLGETKKLMHEKMEHFVNKHLHMSPSCKRVSQYNTIERRDAAHTIPDSMTAWCIDFALFAKPSR